jgi:hypothetical protein
MQVSLKHLMLRSSRTVRLLLTFADSEDALLTPQGERTYPQR